MYYGVLWGAMRDIWDDGWLGKLFTVVVWVAIACNLAGIVLGAMAVIALAFIFVGLILGILI